MKNTVKLLKKTPDANCVSAKLTFLLKSCPTELAVMSESFSTEVVTGDARALSCECWCSDIRSSSGTKCLVTSQFPPMRLVSGDVRALSLGGAGVW